MDMGLPCGNCPDMATTMVIVVRITSGFPPFFRKTDVGQLPYTTVDDVILAWPNLAMLCYHNFKGCCVQRHAELISSAVWPL